MDVVVTGHGGRGGGTAAGSYLVPKGVAIYFFTGDHSVMYSGASDTIMDMLCTTKHYHPNKVRAAAVQKVEGGQTCPNYTCFGTNDFRDKSGVYQVGLSRSKGPMLAIPDGKTKRLSEIIGGASSGGVIGRYVYWLCCRAAPDNSNNINDDADEVIGKVFGYKVGAVEVGSPAGMTPSKVKQLGVWR